MTAADGIGTALFVAYYVVFAGATALLGRLARLPREVVRKSYHVLCSLSVFGLLVLFDNWYAAAAAVVAVFALGYVAAACLQTAPVLRNFRIDRVAQPGELRSQVLSVTAAFVALLTVFWGVLGPEFKVHAAVGAMVWGVGDAAAAVWGKRFGRRQLRHWAFDRGKTMEGALAMAATAWPAVFLTLTLFGGYPWLTALIAAAVLAAAGSLLETLLRKGLDNLILPVAMAGLSVPVTMAAALLGGG